MPRADAGVIWARVRCAAAVPGVTVYKDHKAQALGLMHHRNLSGSRKSRSTGVYVPDGPGIAGAQTINVGHSGY